MPTDDDRRRLLESKFALSAIATLSPLCQDPRHGLGAEASGSQILAARRALLDLLNSQDPPEPARILARQEAADAAERALPIYDHVRGRVRDALLNVDPDAPLTASERARRLHLLRGVFKHSPGALSLLPLDNLERTLKSVVRDLDVLPELRNLNLGKRLALALAPLKTLDPLLRQTIREAEVAEQPLDQARADLDRALYAHALLVRSLLMRSGSDLNPGRLCLALDLDYDARRHTGAPISVEPGIEAVDAELASP